MPEDNELIFKFIIDSLKISGSPFNTINNELIMAQCQVEIPRSFFRPARTENINLQMVCHPELTNKYPGTELITGKSYRLQWFIEGIKTRGITARGTLAYDLDASKIEREIAGLLSKPLNFYFSHPSLKFQPNLLVNFKVCLETDERFEELYSLSINLTSGEIFTGLMAALNGKKIAVHPPKKNLEKRKIPYSVGFNTLFNHLKWILENRDQEWVKNAQSRWEEEIKYLEAFYQGNSEESDSDQSFYRRAAEVYRKFQPVVRIQISNVALLNLPVIHYTLESLDGRPDFPSLLYDPVHRQVRWLYLNRDNQNDKEELRKPPAPRFPS